jgi:hypothetical protein
MPMEGQWERANAPLRSLTPRERNVGLVATVLTTLVFVVIFALHLGDGADPVPAGCIRPTVPWVMGGETFQRCGEQARYLCGNKAGEGDAYARGVLAACREAGLPTGAS